MLKKILKFFIILFLFIAANTYCLAANILDTNLYKYEKIINNDKLVIQSVEENDRQNFEKQLELNNIKYIYQETIEHQEPITLKKQQEKYISKILNDDSLQSILPYFEKQINIDNEEWQGILYLNIEDFSVKKIDNGYREEKISETVVYDYFTDNDLNNIPKTINKSGVILYLTNPQFEVIETKEIDGKSVPTAYKGIMVYEGIGKFKNRDSYKVIAKYSGEISKADTKIVYDLKYQKVIEEEQQEDNTIPYTTITITIILLGIILLLFYFFNTSVKVLAINNNGIIRIFKVNLNPLYRIINIDKYSKKIDCSKFKIELSKKAFKKLNGKDIYLLVNKKKCTQRVLTDNFFVMRGDKDE